MRLSELLRRSARLWLEGAPQALALLAAAAVPAAVLVALALAAGGLTTQSALNAAIEAGQWSRALPALAAGLVQRLALTLAYAAMVFSFDARRAGRPLPFSEVYGFAVERFVPLVLALLRAAAWILGGLALFLVPGIVLGARYSFVHLATLLESRSGAAALDRSAELVDAQPLRAVGSLLVAAALSTAAAVELVLAVSAVAAAARGGAAEPGAIEGAFEVLLSQLTTGLVGAWLTCFGVLLYRELSSARP